ncbi:MAG TPA: transglycosylase SLT domain-containing protein [Allosphingosinicella sp.]|jgi:soluble lytic murein transglycosylase-like protein
MMKLRPLLLAAALAFPAAPALAQESGDLGAATGALGDAQRSAYRDILTAIRAGDWPNAAMKLDTAPDGPLGDALRAELYLAKGSPKVELEPLLALIARAPDLPKADQLARLALTRGATSLPPLAQPQPMLWQGSQPRRLRAQSAPRDAAATEVDGQIQPLIVANRPADAEALFTPRVGDLAADAQTEFRQRIAWSYYIVGDDASALRLAEQARAGSGDWVIQAAWVSGLSSWRMKQCEAASGAFADVAARATDEELAAAAHYWAARADMMCGKPERVQGRLRAAARARETFYGLLAASALGIRAASFEGLHNYRDAEWRPIAAKPNVRAAIAFAELGEADLADQYIRYQARIGGASDHNALLHLAADLSLPGTQFWLAHNAPKGASVNMAARYPRPDWRPSRGWRVDESLVFAHALQESNFRTAVVSPAGATGLLQVRPGTAGDIARSRGEAFSPALLSNPAANMEFGQTYIEGLRDSYATGGLLLKVIAAYNAGPAPVAEWNNRRFDKGDPLLYVESIPYWETRGYVPSVLRNYWIYEQEGGKASGSREALVQGLWPRFPGMPGARAVRLQADGDTRVAYGTE